MWKSATTLAGSATPPYSFKAQAVLDTGNGMGRNRDNSLKRSRRVSG